MAGSIHKDKLAKILAQQVLVKNEIHNEVNISFEDRPEDAMRILFGKYFFLVLGNLAKDYPEFVPIYEELETKFGEENVYPDAFVKVFRDIINSDWAHNPTINNDTRFNLLIGSFLACVPSEEEKIYAKNSVIFLEKGEEIKGLNEIVLLSVTLYEYNYEDDFRDLVMKYYFKVKSDNIKFDYIYTIINIAREGQQISETEGERFIKEYLELSQVYDLEPDTRLHFVLICMKNIPDLVRKSRGLITSDEFNKEIDLYVDSVDQQRKVKFIQMFLKDGAAYGMRTRCSLFELTDSVADGIFDTKTNWQAIFDHIEEIAVQLGIMKSEETRAYKDSQENDGQSNSQSNSGSSSLGTSSQTTDSGGCYIATAVYGSYDCPEVWTFRRYRDEHLASSAFGRMFIKTYYAVSPTVVKWFGETEWFNRFWRGKLDKIAIDLKRKGYDDTPYLDRD